MSDAEFYRVRYLCNNYTLADAFRPQMNWGAKVFKVAAKDLGQHTDEELIQVAAETAPEGYWLQRIEAFGGEPWEREVFGKPVPGAPVAAQPLELLIPTQLPVSIP